MRLKISDLDLDSAPVFRLFLSYFVPSFISMFILSTYVIIDGIFVGHGIGELGLAAIGLSVPLFSFFMALEFLLGVGGASLCGIALGRRKHHRARVIFNSVIYFALIFGSISGIILFIFKKEVALLLGSDEVLLPFAIPYTSVIMLGGVIMVLQSILCSFARNDKAPNLTMMSFLSGTIVNIILNYLFIFEFKWGMFGAAFSTIIGHFIGLLIVLWHFVLKCGNLYFIRRFSFRALKAAAMNGIAPAMTEFAFGFTILLMNVFLIQLGSQSGVAILSIMMYIGAVCFSSILALSQSLQPIVSYNFGANRIERVLKIFKISLFFASFIGFVIYIVLFFEIPNIALIFLKNTTNILNDLIRSVRIYFLGYLFLGANVVAASFLQAIGRIKSSSIVSAAHNLVFMLIFLPIFATFFGVDGIFASYPVSLFCAFLVAIVVLKFEIGRLKK